MNAELAQIFTNLQYPIGTLITALIACHEAGWTESDLRKLSSNPSLTRLALAAVRGQMSAVHAIDCTVTPYEPNGMEFERHYAVPKEPIIWNPAKIEILPMEEFIGGEHTEVVLDGKKDRLLPANVLDYLLHHPDLITPEMLICLDQNKHILFAGTRYQQKALGALRAMSKTEDGKFVGVSYRVQDAGAIRNCVVALLKE